jgi:serine protease
LTTFIRRKEVKIKNLLILPVILLAVGTATLSHISRAGIWQSGAVNRGEIQRSSQPVEGRYVIVFADVEGNIDVPSITSELSAKYNANITYQYQHALKGFAAQMSEESALAISRDARVAFVSEDSIGKPSEVQTNPHWGLDRIDQRNLPVNSTYSYSTTGLGVNAYVIDTGLNFFHSEFQGRAVFDAEFATEPTGGQDCNGHGTSVASMLGGTKYGVAKKVTLHIIRVSDARYNPNIPNIDGRCSSHMLVSQVAEAMDWVAAHHIKPAVVNLSFEASGISSEGSGGRFTYVNANILGVAARGLISAGVTLVNSAGNDNQDASGAYPSSLPEVIVVGASTGGDGKAGFSNYGYTVDLFAPGTDLITADMFGNNSQRTGVYGTSFAAPLVAGAVARYLQTHPLATPAEVQNYIISTATPGKIGGLPGPPFYSETPNRLLYVEP